MKAIFKDAKVYAMGEIKKQTMLLDGATLSVFTGDVSLMGCPVYDNIAIFPGFCDVHVHFREPGFSYKETIASGSRASARGGYTAVCTMPNLVPPPDCPENLKTQTDIIERDSVIAAFPYGTITKGQAGEELSDMEGIKDAVIGYSDDGKGIQTEDLMREAMEKARSLGKMIVAHCEDNSLLRGGYIHDGEYARLHGHRGICSESEFGQIARDLELVKTTGCKYHVCHISTKESVEIIRRAKAEGVDVTCETGPHYLTMCDLDIGEHGRFKMNPPIRSASDRDALVEGIKDGTVDMIATDHAPHSAEEKSRGLEKSNMGVVGIETAFPISYTYLVKTGIITLERLIELLSVKPRERFGITSDAGFTVFDLGDEYRIDPKDFISAGKSTPFEGWSVFGRCLATVYNGKVVYASERLGESVNKSEEI
ncbi:MAG: dihydroorotase [Clostridia bacterium]|nr:dihydroorotase [Clostridia bacterium]